MPQPKPKDWTQATITVCDACKRACCWQGAFMCDYSDMASTEERTVGQLRAGRHGENESYWVRDAGVQRFVAEGGSFLNSPPLTAEEK